jgi:hypothetical protein
MINNKVLLISALIPLLLIIAPLAMAQPQGWISGFVKGAPPMPIDVELKNANVIFRSALWYLNATDDHFHVKGLVENTVPRAASVVVALNFHDNATGTTLATGGIFSYGPPSGIAANVTIPFDINTGYNASSTNEFKTLGGDMA